jgi:hypothetical protein
MTRWRVQTDNVTILASTVAIVQEIHRSVDCPRSKTVRGSYAGQQAAKQALGYRAKPSASLRLLKGRFLGLDYLVSPVLPHGAHALLDIAELCEYIG